MNALTLLHIFTSNIKKRKIYLQQKKLEAYRLYDQDEKRFPFVIDIYKDNAVIHIFQSIEKKTFTEIEQSLQKLLDIQNFFYKNRSKENVFLPSSSPKITTIAEYGHTFQINLAAYLDTGLFLDHRETRKWIQARSKDKIVLNTFAYTGSFTVYAAAGGAAKTFSVDLSKTYCEWIKKNLELNYLPSGKNWVFKMDTFEFFKYAKKKELIFDIIIIDPPSFSRNKGQSFSVEKDHPTLINNALELLNPNGFILFSNNKIDFKLKTKELRAHSIKNFTAQTIPPDFTNPQTHHCFIIT